MFSITKKKIFSDNEDENYQCEKEDLTEDIEQMKYLVKETPEDNPEIDLNEYLKYRNSLN